MPVTANGTAYTVYTASLPTHGQVVWGVANASVGGSNIPTVLYAHGASGAADQFASLPAWSGLRDWLIDNGWAWVEGDGGGPQSWGNPAARAAYPAYLAHVETILDLGVVVLLGRSMGGLVTAWLYAQYSGRSRFSGWINNSGVSTLFLGTLSDPDMTNRPSGQYFSSGTYPAWGVSSYGALQTAAADAAPESWPASVWDGKRILCLYGDADTTVPWTPRGAEPLRTLWAGHPTVDDFYRRSGGDHTGTNGSYLDVNQMTPFLYNIGGGTAAPELPTPTYTRVVNGYLIVNGNRHRYTPKPLTVIV